jgi:hypothetical protein
MGAGLPGSARPTLSSVAAVGLPESLTELWKCLLGLWDFGRVQTLTSSKEGWGQKQTGLWGVEGRGWLLSRRGLERGQD